jgi:uncharacterized membrane protein YeiH
MLVADVISIVDLAATTVFANSAVLAAAWRRNEFLGFVLFPTIADIGGGKVPCDAGLLLSPRLAKDALHQ